MEDDIVGQNSLYKMWQIIELFYLVFSEYLNFHHKSASRTKKLEMLSKYIARKDNI